MEILKQMFPGAFIIVVLGAAVEYGKVFPADKFNDLAQLIWCFITPLSLIYNAGWYRAETVDYVFVLSCAVTNLMGIALMVACTFVWGKISKKTRADWLTQAVDFSSFIISSQTQLTSMALADAQLKYAMLYDISSLVLFPVLQLLEKLAQKCTPKEEQAPSLLVAVDPSTVNNALESQQADVHDAKEPEPTIQPDRRFATWIPSCALLALALLGVVVEPGAKEKRLPYWISQPCIYLRLCALSCQLFASGIHFFDTIRRKFSWRRLGCTAAISLCIECFKQICAPLCVRALVRTLSQEASDAIDWRVCSAPAGFLWQIFAVPYGGVFSLCGLLFMWVFQWLWNQ